MNREKVFWIGVSAVLLSLIMIGSQSESWRSLTGADDRSLHPSGEYDGEIVSSTGDGKLRNRPVSPPSPTHLPEALPRFFLPSLRIDQMSLGDALDVVLSKYNEACSQSGEVPLRIRFLIPPAEGKRISLSLDSMSFDQAMVLLAAVSGLDVKRNGVTYKFMELTFRQDVSEKKNVRVSPDIEADLTKVLGTHGATLQEIISGSGLLTNSDIVVTTGKDGSVTVSEGTASDREFISNLLAKLSVKNPIQHKVTTKIVELPDGFDLGISDGSVLLDPELQVLMRNLAMSEDTNFLTMPSMVTRPDQPGDIEIGREIFVPKPGVVNPSSADDFTSFTVGKSMSVRMSPLGFGHDLSFRYEDSDIIEGPGEVLSKHRIGGSNGSGFQKDDETKVSISQKDDGGFIATFVTATLIDATGRPISQSSSWQDTYRK